MERVGTKVRKHNYYSIAFSTVIPWQWIFFSHVQRTHRRPKGATTATKLSVCWYRRKVSAFVLVVVVIVVAPPMLQKEKKPNQTMWYARSVHPLLISSFVNILFYFYAIFISRYEKKTRKKRKVTNVTFRFWDMVSVIACNHMTRTMKYWKFCSVVVDSFFLSLSIGVHLCEQWTLFMSCDLLCMHNATTKATRFAKSVITTVTNFWIARRKK